MNFAVVPAGKHLTITNLGCLVGFEAITARLGEAHLLLVNANGGVALSATPRLTWQTYVSRSAGLTAIFVSNDTIKATAAAGQRFRVYAKAVKSTDGSPGTVQLLRCFISGSLN